MAEAAKAKALTKSQIIAALSESSEVPKKDVAKVFDELAALIAKSMSKKGVGVFNLLGLIKLTLVQKPATPARPGKNPFTGEAITIKAKPARKDVKARALKALRELAGK